MICGEGEIGVFEDDKGRVATEFERDALERVCGALHHGFSGCGGSGEADVADRGVADEGIEGVGACGW